jgi:hypothetical protein
VTGALRETLKILRGILHRAVLGNWQAGASSSISAASKLTCPCRPRIWGKLKRAKEDEEKQEATHTHWKW